MSIYKKILLIRQSLPDFKKDREVDGVKIISDEQMNQALVPLLNTHGVITIPHGQIIGDTFLLEMEFVDTEDDSRCVANMSFPISSRDYHFGATATLAEKYLYKMLFKIYTGEEGGNSLTKEQVRDKAFSSEHPDAVIQPKPTVKIEDMAPPEGMMLAPKDDLAAAIAEVVKEQNLVDLPLEKPAKEEPEPSQILCDKINAGDWEIKVPLNACLSEVKVVEALDKIYASTSTQIYGSADNDLCPINPYKVIDKFPRRSNLKIRRCIIQFRVFGEEAFWAQIKVETQLEKEAAIALITSPPPVIPQEEEILPVIHKLNLDFNIPEHMGTDRDEEICLQLLDNLRKMGVVPVAIIYAFGKMTLKPEMDTTKGDDAMILEFLAKASELQITEMIKIAKSAG